MDKKNSALKLLTFVAILVASQLAFASQTGCVPFPQVKVNLVQVGSTSLKKVDGEIAEFDPCHSSVSLIKPSVHDSKFGDKPPVVVLIHGGSGLGGYQRDVASIWRGEGYATLLFDAFEMNGLSSSSDLVKYKLHSVSKQQIIYKAAMGAYIWLRNSKDVNVSKIYFQGHSQGGVVAINLADAVDGNHVKGIIAEGAPPYGVGFPNHIKVPLLVMYGERDMYGTQGEVMYQIEPRCDMGAYDTSMPEGYGKT